MKRRKNALIEKLNSIIHCNTSNKNTIMLTTRIIKRALNITRKCNTMVDTTCVMCKANLPKHELSKIPKNNYNSCQLLEYYHYKSVEYDGYGVISIFGSMFSFVIENDTAFIGCITAMIVSMGLRLRIENKIDNYYKMKNALCSYHNKNYF